MSEFNQSFDGLSLTELEAMRVQMDKTIKEMERNERQVALHQIQLLVQQFKFLPFEVFAKPVAAKKKVADKYYDPSTGLSWSGRGRTPTWLKDKTLSDYLISANPQPTEPAEAKGSGLLGAMATAGVIKT